MTPAHAPFPTDCSRRFQLLIGSQTSVVISESVVGVNVSATRQKAGRLLKAAFGLALPGGVKVPVTISACVTTPLATGLPCRRSQSGRDCANAGAAEISN